MNTGRYAFFGTSRTFRLDLDTYCLTEYKDKEWSSIFLQKMPAQILAFYVQHPREEVMHKNLWDNVLPQENWREKTKGNIDSRLKTHMKVIRRALGDDARHPEYILTLSGGYKFIAPVTYSDQSQSDSASDSQSIAGTQVANTSRIAHAGGNPSLYEDPDTALSKLKHPFLEAKIVRIVAYVGHTFGPSMVSWNFDKLPVEEMRILLRDPDSHWMIPNDTDQKKVRYDHLRYIRNIFNQYSHLRKIKDRVKIRYLPSEPSLKALVIDNTVGYLGFYTVEAGRGVPMNDRIKEVTDYTARLPVFLLDSSIEGHAKIIDEFINWFDTAWEQLTRTRALIFNLDGILDFESDVSHLSESSITLDNTLVDYFRELKAYYKFAVVTKATRSQAEKMLNELNILSFIEGNIVALADERIIKSATDSYLLIHNNLNIQLKNCVVIGNSLNDNLYPATQLGMRTQIVQNSVELYNYLKERIREPILNFA